MEKFRTADGSDSLISTQFGEAYHSRHGAITESRHVFIDAGLLPMLSNKDQVHVLEIGLGTGLNALLSLQVANDLKKDIRYTAYELYPISPEQAASLNYSEQIQRLDLYPLFQSMHEMAWGEEVPLTPHFKLEKREQDFNTINEIGRYDLIYMDAFAPAAQSEFWEDAFIERLCDSLKPGGVLVTYCAKGSFKRALKAAGMTVEGIPGPPGKREMTRAVKM